MQKLHVIIVKQKYLLWQKCHQRMIVSNSGGSRGGAVCGYCTRPQTLWRPFKWRPFDANAPLFGAYRSSRNKGKSTQSQLKIALHFVELQYLRDGL